MSEWKNCKLGGITSKIGSGATPTGGGNAYKAEGISLIRSQNVLDFSFTEDGLAYIDQNQADELRNVEVVENDILINITGESVTRCCIVPKRYLPARVNQHVSIVRPFPDNADFRFVYYYFHAIKPELHSMAEIGCTRRALTKGMLENLDILLPPLPEQKAIAAVLSSLDDKIDLLHRQNKTLEAMAETLFRQWFVEEADEGWEEFSFGEITITISGYNHNRNELSDYGDFLLSMGSVVKKFGISFDSMKRINNHAASTKHTCSVGDIILTTRDVTQNAELLGSPGVIPTYFKRKTVILGSNLYKIEIVTDKINQWILYELLKSNIYRDYVKEVASGTSILMLKKSDLDAFRFKLPNQTDLNEYSAIFKKIYERVDCNYTSVLSLKKLRDTLLPKLMSGEVRVKT